MCIEYAEPALKPCIRKGWKNLLRCNREHPARAVGKVVSSRCDDRAEDQRNGKADLEDGAAPDVKIFQHHHLENADNRDRLLWLRPSSRWCSRLPCGPVGTGQGQTRCPQWQKIPRA